VFGKFSVSVVFGNYQHRTVNVLLRQRLRPVHCITSMSTATYFALPNTQWASLKY